MLELLSTAPTRRHAVLRARREALIARSSVLREQALGRLDQAEPLVLRAQQLRAGWRWVCAYRHSLSVAALVAGVTLAVLRPRRAWRLGRWVWSGWQLWRRLQARSQQMRAPQAWASQPAPVPLWQQLLWRWLAKR